VDISLICGEIFLIFFCWTESRTLLSFLDVALIVEGSHRDLPALALVRDSAVKVYCPCKFL
jgi:hypothetical protein